jgi:hypothetical protein
VLARGLHQCDDIVTQAVIHTHSPNIFCQARNLGSGDHTGQCLNGVVLPQVDQHAAFFVGGKIAEAGLKEKAIQLRFGQRKGAFILDRVLCCQDQEGARQHARHTIDRDLALAHTFQERCLGTRGGAVDLVGEENVGKGGTRDKLKLSCLLVIDADTCDVAGQEVGRALQAAEVCIETQRQRTSQHRLADARHIFEQDMAFTK